MQNFADSRVRVKGRFVKKEDEAILMELNTLTTKEVGRYIIYMYTYHPETVFLVLLVVQP